MAKSNAERQAKWREANRALFNFRRRNARKSKGGDASCREILNIHPNQSNALPTVQSSGGAKTKIEELRQLIEKESEKPAETPTVAPTVFRDDFGRVIPEAAWKRLQERKEKAKNNGYTIDEYSQ